MADAAEAGQEHHVLFTDKEKEDGHHLVPSKPEDFKGPVAQRRTTDVLFLLAILASWVCMTSIGIKALANGNPYKLINGMDDKGRICGVSNGVLHKPKWYVVTTELVGICVEECPSVTGNITNLDDWVCLDGVNVTSGVSQCLSGGSLDLSLTNCECNLLWKSKSVIHRCYIYDSTIKSTFEKAFDVNYITKFFADVLTAAPVIFGFGIGIALVLSFIFARLMRIHFLAGILVWSCILAVLVIMISISIVMWNTGVAWYDASPQTHKGYEIKGMKAMGCLFGVIAALYFCTMVFMRSRINLAIAIVKEAARVLAAMPIIVATPLFQFFGSVLFFIPWIFYILYLAGTGTVSTVTYTDATGTTHNTKKFKYDSTVKDQAWYLLFCLFWALNFIIALGQIANAMAVASWYFRRDKSTVGNATVFESYRKTCRYHTGTAAFGAVIIAVIQTIRAVILFMQRQAKATKNKIAEYVLCCLQCCMWCVEKCMKFIDRNAYIQTAIMGKPFFPAAKAAFFLILRNILRVAAVHAVSGFILVIGKVFVMCFSGALSYYFMQSYYGNQLNSLVGPTLLVMALAWFTASMFCEVFGMAIDTLLQCFVIDEEWFEPGERYADDDLKNFVNSKGEHKDKERFLRSMSAKTGTFAPNNGL